MWPKLEAEAAKWQGLHRVTGAFSLSIWAAKSIAIIQIPCLPYFFPHCTDYL